MPEANKPAAGDMQHPADGGVRAGSLRRLDVRRRFGRGEWLALGIALAVHAAALALVPGPLNNALRQAPEIVLALNLRQPNPLSREDAVESSLAPALPVGAEQRSAHKDEQHAAEGPSVARPLQQPVGNMPPNESALKPVVASESQPEPVAAATDPAQIWAELGAALELRDAADSPDEAERQAADESEPAEGNSGEVDSSAEQSAESPEPGLTADVDAEALLREYTVGIRRLIETEKFYPPAAERLGHSGTVKVGFVIGPLGDVSGIYIKEGSGFGTLDAAAMEAVRQAARFPAIPPELGRNSLALSVSLRYSLR